MSGFLVGFAVGAVFASAFIGCVVAGRCRR